VLHARDSLLSHINGRHQLRMSSFKDHFTARDFDLYFWIGFQP
jgi:hypothetical protein